VPLTRRRSKTYAPLRRFGALKTGLVTLGLVSLLGSLAVTAGAAASAATTETTLWPSTAVPAIMTDPDTQSVELGVAFVPQTSGSILGVRFYKGPQNTGTHTGRLWSGSGALLAKVTFRNETASGWQEARFAAPVKVVAGQRYVASYHAYAGRYSATQDYFAGKSVSNGQLVAPASTAGRGNGVYRYGSPAFPNQTYRSSNYWVDVVFASSAPTTTPAPTAPAPTPTAPAPTPTTPAPAPTTPAPPPTTPPVTTLPTGVTLRDPDGGPVSQPSRFPVGVWFESVTSQTDVDRDKAAGLNTYVGLTTNSDLARIRSNGLQSMLQQSEWLSRNPTTFDSWILADEIDMTEGPSGVNSLARIAAALPQDGKRRYNNYGKGIGYWQTDAEAARFFNSGFQDTASADLYWFTDPNICSQWEGAKLVNGATRALTTAECRKASNYGLTVDRMRYLDGLDGKRQRMWNFVEVGHPFSEEWAPSITPAQVSAAVWQSVIAGAQGIVYFNHSFAGACPTQHALREPCYAAVRAEVSKTNALLQQLAPVLNGPFADGYVSASSGVRAMAKRHDGAFYVFAGSTQPTGQTATLTVKSGTTATVVGEGRSVPIVDGKIVDTFADGNAVHIYSIR
jgi:hypothetical protein